MSGMRANGPGAAKARTDTLAGRAEKLWSEFAATSRAEIADHPGRFNDACAEITAIAHELVTGGPD